MNEDEDKEQRIEGEERKMRGDDWKGRGDRSEEGRKGK